MSVEAREPGGWELHRQLQTILDALQRIEDRMVPRPEFELFKQEQERRHKAADDRLTSIQGEKSLAHGRIEAQVNELRQQLDRDQDDRYQWAREVNTRAWVGLGAGVLALVGGGLASALGW